MAIRLTPYIGFKDNAREAMEFYHSILGGKLDVSLFKDFGASEDPTEGDKVMHSMLVVDDGLVIMAADTPNRVEYTTGTNMSVSVSGEKEDDAKLRGWFEKLSEGGHIEEPLAVAPWGDAFGMFTDKFGVHWMINIAGEPAASTEATATA